ncbi:MAG: threonine ammonia-lyase, biosynthetic [Gammaproteobacteria bacterium]|nr:threonine ammonia-lyase, biosynthetic [Gammaproteobacteria bacterium]MCY4281620.1 threonine ammonia-lyase, biosynthetic [Gammaproteobacteria bacterium]
MFAEYQPLIQAAAARVYDVARCSALDYAVQASQALDNRVWLKREDQQSVFSYKLRGAYNLIATLDDAQRRNGVIAASAGNHAQGVALAAARMNISATIVMPKTAPEIKVNAVRRLQARVALHGNTYDEARLHAEQLAADEGRTFIPPYDHPLVIAGQATVGVELLQQCEQQAHCIFVPVGGGGLIAGIALHVKAHSPDTLIIGVEHDGAASMYRALQAGTRVALNHVDIFADGAAVRQAGEETFRICRELVDEVLTVNVDEICAAVKDIYEDTRSIPEPAGALALTGLKQYVQREQLRDKRLVAIVSGANVNFDRLRHIAELSALGEQREALLCTTIAERPGSFRTLCHDLGARQITEFNYRYCDSEVARIFVGVQLRHGIREKDQLLANLRDKGYQVTDLSNDEVAKMHIRYMVGGHAPALSDELLYRFEFPERSGALLHFLTQLSSRWNISLFHYRNHGAAYGRVLMGIQVPPQLTGEFQQFLDGLGIKYSEETNNPAYRLFLS